MVKQKNERSVCWELSRMFNNVCLKCCVLVVGFSTLDYFKFLPSSGEVLNYEFAFAYTSTQIYFFYTNAFFGLSEMLRSNVSHVPFFFSSV